MRTVVLLAAGRGTRLHPLTESLPKCLLDVGGRTILDRLIDHFRDWAERCIVVSGFEPDKLRAHLADIEPPGELVVQHNPDFDVTNSMYSAQLASAFWRDASAAVFTNADVLFRRAALDSILAAREPLALSVDLRDCDAEDMKVALDGDGRIVRVSKELSLATCAGEFTGVALAQGKGLEELERTMQSMLADPEMKARGWYDLALDTIARTSTPLACAAVPSNSYWEVDTPEDLTEVRASGFFSD